MKKSLILAVILVVSVSTVCFAEETGTVQEAFTKGTVHGTLGSYYEYKNMDAANSDFSWATGYITLKYETQSWKNLQLGTRFFAQGQLHSDHDDGITDAYSTDIEKNITLPELYVNYAFTENSSIRAGRWNHKKITHIDDAQSEGFYLTLKEIPRLEIITGIMTRFAEIDYDDGEDFGRTNHAQDLDSEETYGSDSKQYLFFLETTLEVIEEIAVNPYFMYQDGYASVWGLDTMLKDESEKYEVSYGGDIKYRHIKADITGRDNAHVWAVMPFIKKGPVTLDFSYSKFDNGNALNHPNWLLDDMSLVDQDVVENNAGAEVYEARIKFAREKWWTSLAYATADYDTSASEGDGYRDLEIQIGYNFTKKCDVNVRFFDVNFDNIVDKDYQKVETRIRFKF